MHRSGSSPVIVAAILSQAFGALACSSKLHTAESGEICGESAHPVEAKSASSTCPSHETWDIGNCRLTTCRNPSKPEVPQSLEYRADALTVLLVLCLLPIQDTVPLRVHKNPILLSGALFECKDLTWHNHGSSFASSELIASVTDIHLQNPVP